MQQRFQPLEKKAGYTIEYDTITGTIKGNYRDAMVSITITRLPEDAAAAAAILKEFVTFLQKDGRIGGKMLLRLSGELRAKFGAAPEIAALFKQQHHSAPLKYISHENLTQFIAVVRTKDKIKSKLQNDSLQLLVTPEDYADKYAALNDFKREHSSFQPEVFGYAVPYTQYLVTPAKIAAGLYSTEAEFEKINNHNVRHFALYDAEKNEFVATLQVMIDNDLAYVSDVIVNKNKRKQGYAELIAVRAYESLLATHPEVKHVYAIGGVAGNSVLQPFMKRNQFSLTDVTPAAQQAQGLLPIFVPPGDLLLVHGVKKTGNPPSALRRNALLAGSLVVAAAVMYVISSQTDDAVYGDKNRNTI